MKQADRRAIIDIGSNSIRLVVFGGALRAPAVLYNEKFGAELGRGVIETGALDALACDAAIETLARFHALVKLMKVDSLRVAATAAVRDATNGPEFLARIRKLGLRVELLSGEEEARAAGYGVISSICEADGLAADLGGGSLELVRVANGATGENISLNIGILRVAKIRARGPGKLRKWIEKRAADLDWLAAVEGKPLYLVGGSWRALTRVHIHLTGHPLPVIGNHEMPADAPAILVKKLRDLDSMALRQIPSMPEARIPMLADSAALLAALVAVVRPAKLVTCASGLREGLLFEDLPAKVQREDPLIAGARFAAEQHVRFPGYGGALVRWLDGLFGDQGADLVRLRHAVCLLADLGWSSNPEFRALSGEEMALHGNWVGVNARDRAIMAMALFASFGGYGTPPDPLGALASKTDLARANSWGLAIRLAHRFSGGTAEALDKSPARFENGKLVVRSARGLDVLDSASVRQRTARLLDSLI